MMGMFRVELFKPFGLQLDHNGYVVNAESVASEAGVQAGMKLVRVNDGEINTVDNLRALLAKHPTGVKAALEFTSQSSRTLGSRPSPTKRRGESTSSTPAWFSGTPREIPARIPASPPLAPSPNNPQWDPTAPDGNSPRHSDPNIGWDFAEPAVGESAQSLATDGSSDHHYSDSESPPPAGRTRGGSVQSLGDPRLEGSGPNSLVLLATMLEQTEISLNAAQDENMDLQVKRELLLTSY